MKALSKLNRGKAADIMGMTAEHLLFSEDDTFLVILNEILHKASIYRLNEDWVIDTSI